MYKKMLVPLDGSGFSECSLAHVKAIAKGCGVPEVVLLRVVEPIIPPAYEDANIDWAKWMVNAEKRARKEAEDYLSQIADSLKKDGVVAKTAVVSGQPAEAILDYTERNKTDVIVMSTHGRSGVTRWVLGSVADRVLRHSVAPVLIVSPAGCRT